MAVSSNALSNPNYPDLFRTYIIRNAEYILERVQQATASLPSEDQKLAVHTLSFTLKLDEAWPLTRQLVLIIAPKMEQVGERDSWIVYLEGALEQSQQLGDAEAEAELRFHLGLLYQYQAKYREAEVQLELSAAHFEEAHLKARALNRLAGVARRQGRFSEATQLAEMALALSTSANAEQAFSYFVLGAIAFDQRAWQKAKHFLEKSLALWEGTNNERLIAWGLTNLGPALWALEKYNDAIACYERAINLFETIQDPVHQAIARMNLGNVYLKLDRFADALSLYLEAEPTFRRTTDRLCLAMVNHNTGMAYQNLQQWKRAIKAYKFSIELWQSMNQNYYLINSLDSLGTVYLEQKLYDKAIITFQDALDRLAQFENEPSYDHLLDLVTTHLHDAKKQSA